MSALLFLPEKEHVVKCFCKIHSPFFFVWKKELLFYGGLEAQEKLVARVAVLIVSASGPPPSKMKKQ